MNVAFFGSSLVSSFWNGAATYYRGLVRALAERGHEVTFFEPDAYERQAHRDIADPTWAKVVVYEPSLMGVRDSLREARSAAVVIKCSGVGVLDELLERDVLKLASPATIVGYCDVDAPATLDRVARDVADPFRKLIPRYDFVFTYGGGEPVRSRYSQLGAKSCVPIYNALDASTHHPVPPVARFAGSLAFLGNRLPDREARVDEFFFAPAARSPEQRFLLGGSGWQDKARSSNVEYLGHVGTSEHNAFNSTLLAVLNVSRESMAGCGFSPATRIFEAAGAGACIITDAWEGIDCFLQPGSEILVAHDGAQVGAHLAGLTLEVARQIGQRAQQRVLRDHSCAARAAQLEQLLLSTRADRSDRAIITGEPGVAGVE